MAKSTKEVKGKAIEVTLWEASNKLTGSVWCYLPVERDEVYVEIFEQAENFKNNRN